MNKKIPKEAARCQICETAHHSELCRAMLVRPAVVKLIRKRVKNWDENGWICYDDLQKFQFEYVRSLLETEKGELSELEMQVLNGLKEHEITAQNPEVITEGDRTFGEWLADHIAGFGGSWSFIIFFAVVLTVWMFVNSWVMVSRPFDPYPYILLNLVLSTLAALQAPVIMMSQNRQESRDRERAMYDYKVNLKAELEIRQLHQKIDHLLSNQWERLVEIQEVQMELINELRRSKPGG